MSDDENFSTRGLRGRVEDRAVTKPAAPRPSWAIRLIGAALVCAMGYGVYFWEVRRVVVDPNHVLVLLKKNGSKTLPGDNIIIPKPPDTTDPNYAAKYKAWEDQYGDCNGILEQVLPEGTYFSFSPFDYERGSDLDRAVGDCARGQSGDCHQEIRAEAGCGCGWESHTDIGGSRARSARAAPAAASAGAV